VAPLIEADERLRDAGRPGLVVRGAYGSVRQIFEILRVTSLLEVPDPAPPAAPAGRPAPAERLDRSLRDARMSVTDLYVAYFALGGTAELAEVAAYLAGDAEALDVHQRELAVQAVNERLLDLGHPDRLLSFHPGERGRDWT
jgi:hypothetical protein